MASRLSPRLGPRNKPHHNRLTCIERLRMSLTLGNSPSIDDRTVAGVLSEIADIASETLELQDVFDRVAAAVRRVIPSDYIGVIRLSECGGVLHTLNSKHPRF